MSRRRLVSVSSRSEEGWYITNLPTSYIFADKLHIFNMLQGVCNLHYFIQTYTFKSILPKKRLRKRLNHQINNVFTMNRKC